MSKNIGYINLEKALANNEFKLYLSSDPQYTSKTIRGADVMNDFFFDVTVALNDYEGALYKNGLMGVYGKIDQTIYENKGIKICGNLNKEPLDLI